MRVFGAAGHLIVMGVLAYSVLAESLEISDFLRVGPSANRSGQEVLLSLSFPFPRNDQKWSIYRWNVPAGTLGNGKSLGMAGNGAPASTWKAPEGSVGVPESLNRAVCRHRFCKAARADPSGISRVPFSGGLKKEMVDRKKESCPGRIAG